MSKYPQLEINLDKLRDNIRKIKKLCKASNIQVAGVIKGANSLLEIAKVYDEENVSFIASSRIEQLKKIKDKVNTPLLLTRLPMLSEVKDVIKYSNISLNSEIEVIKKLNKEAKKQNKIHEVILMKEVGDLREGYYSDEELINDALFIENNLDNISLAGLGTNIGCYGSVTPTKKTLQKLVDTSKKVEKALGRKLKYLSGGSTSVLTRVIDKTIPKEINLLRIGEACLIGRELEDLYGLKTELNKNIFTLKAEVIEIKDKPSYPEGEILCDAFRHKPKYIDKGIRKRAILAIGAADYGYLEGLISKDEGIELIGASSDHTILDVEDYKKEIKIGDIIELNIHYISMLYLTKSKDVKEVFVSEEKNE